jgi:hypothetical protein
MQRRQVILRAYGQLFELQEYNVPDPGPGSHTFKLEDVNEAFDQAEWDQQQTLVTRALLVP